MKQNTIILQSANWIINLARFIIDLIGEVVYNTIYKRFDGL